MALGIGLSSAHNYYVPIFEPSDILNLALWLEYNTGITSEDDETSAAGNLDDNDKIKQWDDQSGNSNHAVQTTTTDMPRYESDDNSVKFANKAKFMDLTSNISINANTDFTCIMRVNFSPNFDTDVGLVGHGGNDLFRALADGTGFRTKMSDTVQSNWVEASDALVVDTYYIITLTRSNGATGNLTVHVDGGAFSDKEWDAAEGATDVDAFTISNVGCAADDVNNLLGYVKDVLIYNGTALSGGQRTQMYNYLNGQT